LGSESPLLAQQHGFPDMRLADVVDHPQVDHSVAVHKDDISL
jgi:hypothetical protein